MTSNSSGQIDLMHWLIRLIAFIIDWIIVGIVAYIIYFVAFVAAVLSGSAILIGTYFFLPLFWGILLVIYFSYSRCLLGRDNREKNHGIASADGKRRQSYNRQIIYP